jgi:hypothetical protein
MAAIGTADRESRSLSPDKPIAIISSVSARRGSAFRRSHGNEVAPGLAAALADVGPIASLISCRCRRSSPSTRLLQSTRRSPPPISIRSRPGSRRTRNAAHSARPARAPARIWPTSCGRPHSARPAVMAIITHARRSPHTGAVRFPCVWPLHGGCDHCASPAKIARGLFTICS